MNINCLHHQAECYKKWMLETAAWVDLNQQLPYDGFNHLPLNQCLNLIIFCVPPLALGDAVFCCIVAIALSGFSPLPFNAQGLQRCFSFASSLYFSHISRKLCLDSQTDLVGVPDTYPLAIYKNQYLLLFGEVPFLCPKTPIL